MPDVTPLEDVKRALIGGEKRVIRQRVWGIHSTPDGDRYDGTAQETEYEWVLQDTDPPVQDTDPETGDPLWEDPPDNTIPVIEQEWVQNVIRDEQVDWTEKANQANAQLEDEQEGGQTRNRHSWFIAAGDWWDEDNPDSLPDAYSTPQTAQQQQFVFDQMAKNLEKANRQIASLTKAVNRMGGSTDEDLG